MITTELLRKLDKILRLPILEHYSLAEKELGISSVNSRKTFYNIGHLAQKPYLMSLLHVYKLDHCLCFFCCWWNCLICHACVLLQFAVAFCGLGFTSLYLAGKLHCFQAQGRGQGWKLCIALTPLIAAMALALTRYSDYRHHWQGILDSRKVTISGSPGLVDNYFIIHTGKSWKL